MLFCVCVKLGFQDIVQQNLMRPPTHVDGGGTIKYANRNLTNQEKESKQIDHQIMMVEQPPKTLTQIYLSDNSTGFSNLKHARFPSEIFTKIYP